VKIKIFRWRAIAPLLLCLVLLGVLWLVFGDMLVEDTGEEVSTELLGTQVDLNGLRLRETEAKVELAGIQVADPFNPMKNLFESGRAILELDPAALVEKKFVIDRLRIENLRVGTTRRTPAAPVSGEGFAPTLLREVRRWSSQFDVPLLQLTPFDTVKALVLDPSQLSTIRQAGAVITLGDSLRTAFTQSLAALNIRPTVDSARALAERLAAANPARLGLAGTREAVQSVRRTLQQVEQTRDRITALERSVETGVGQLRAGVVAVDDARQRDYAFARSLLQLPSFAAPDIGAALFGRVSIDRFEKAVYWAELAQRNLPPGLRPQVRPAPKRLRMDGTTVGFPKERAYPAFLLREGSLDVSFDAFGGSHSLAATATGLTSEPTLYGKPAAVHATGRIGGAHPMAITAGGIIDHRGTIRDSARLALTGVPLPAFAVPGLPFQVQPGTGTSNLVFTMKGQQVSARWSLLSTSARWTADSAQGSGLGTLENLIWRVLSGLNRLEVTAELSGTIRAPRFSVHSNLDEAIAARVRSVMGEEIQAAERRVRAQVDALVGEKVEAVRQQADTVATELKTRIASARQELDTVKTQLEARLKTLTGGLGGVLGM
jgi:uncharacterized protein (TIGR03545 family)